MQFASHNAVLLPPDGVYFCVRARLCVCVCVFFIGRARIQKVLLHCTRQSQFSRIQESFSPCHALWVITYRKSGELWDLMLQ